MNLKPLILCKQMIKKCKYKETLTITKTRSANIGSLFQLGTMKQSMLDKALPPAGPEHVFTSGSIKISPYSTENCVRVGYPMQTKLIQTT